MKKFYFKLFLLTAVMIVGGGKAWGQTTIYERGTTTAWASTDIGSDAWSEGTIGSNGLEVTNGVSSTIAINPESDTSILTWTATWNPGDATGTPNNTNAYIKFGDVTFAFFGSSWFTKVTIGSTTTTLSDVGKTRSRDYYISVTINQSTKAVSYTFTDNGTVLSGNGTISNTASSYDLTHGLGGKSPNWTNTAILKTVQIVETENTAQNADYTVKYVCDGEEIKDPVVRTGEVGSSINLLETDKENIYSSDNTAKYVYSSDDASAKTIEEDGTTVATVYFTKSNSYTYSVTNNFGTTIASGSTFEGETATVCWSKYIQNDGVWYEVTNPYGITISEATSHVVNYVESDIFCAFENSNLVLSRSYGNLSNNPNYSNGDAYAMYEGSNLTTTTKVSAGSYILTVNTTVRRANDDILKVQISSDGNEWDEYSTMTLSSNVGGDFNIEIELDEDSYIRFVNTGSNLCHYIDYVVLKEKKTKVTVDFVEANGADATIIVNDEVVTNETTFAVGEYSFTATAQGYDNYEGTFTVTDDDLLLDKKTVNFQMMAEDDVASIVVKYMFEGTEIASEPMDLTGFNTKVGESHAVPFRMYVEKDGELYQTTKNSSNSYYGENTTLEKNTVIEKNVSVVDLNGGTLAFFVDLDNSTAQNANIRASYCSAYDNKSFTSEKTLEAGTYTFIIRKQNKGRGSSIAVGSTTIYNIDGGNGSWGDVTLENVKISEPGFISLVAGGSNTYDDYDIIIAILQKNTETITVTSANARTYCSENNLDFSEVAGVKAYYLTVDGDKIEQAVAGAVAANTGVYIEATAGSYEIPIVENAATPVSNDLTGVTVETVVTDLPIYVLMSGDSGVGFYKANNAFTVGANTAYIPGAAVPSGVKALGFGNNDDPTTGINGINNTALTDKNAVIYNLAGQRVAAPTKGIYIVNGKKVMVK